MIQGLKVTASAGFSMLRASLRRRECLGGSVKPSQLLMWEMSDSYSGSWGAGIPRALISDRSFASCGCRRAAMTPS